MFKYAVVLLCLAAASQGKIRYGRLPEKVWAQNPHLRTPLNERIVGGSEVEPNSIPFQVSLQYPTYDFHFCGGTILDSDTIITAAHCCDGQSPSDLRVNAGEHSLNFDDGTEQSSGVSKIIMHEDYNSRTVENDICLLKLTSSLSLNSAVAGADLPYQGQTFSGKGVVSGWGTLSPGGSSPDKLRSVTVPLVSDLECKAAYGYSAIYDTMLCAGEAGKDSCQGDSGGPLTCGGTHCGIVSWGYSCAAPGYPGVYTETAQYINWVGSHA